MTPTELDQIRNMINEAVDTSIKRNVQPMVKAAVRDEVTRVVNPLREDLDALKGEAKTLEADTRKHSGAHKDLAKDVTKTSENDLKQDAAIAQILTKVATIEAKQDAAKDDRDSLAPVIDRIHESATKFFNRHPALTLALVGVITALANVVTAWLTK